MVENNDMRETLQNMQTELINLLNHQNEDYEINTEVGKNYLLRNVHEVWSFRTS